MIEPNFKYQVKVELEKYLYNEEAFTCEGFLNSRLDLPGFVKCKVFGKIVEIVFHPPQAITEEYVFEQIEQALQEIGLQFLRATLRQYVGNAARTMLAALTGGAIGSKAGAAGALLGLIGGAIIEKAIFDWKNICECKHDEFGSILISHFITNVGANNSLK